MFTNRLPFVFLGLACVAAAGGGAYFASRQNAVESAPSAAQPAVSGDAAAVSDRPGAVAETEAVLDEAVPGREKHAGVSTPAVEIRSGRGDETPSRRTTRPNAADRRPAARPARDARSSGDATRNPDAAARPGPTETADKTVAAATAPPLPDAPSTWRTTENAVDSNTAEPAKSFEELVVSADSVIGLQIETALTSEQARVEDRVEARVTRDVKVGDQVAIPAGARMIGSVTQVERGGKVKERARLGIRFHTLVLADGTRTSLNSETIYREGASPTGESAAKIGGAAVGGAILGAILGGSKGAVIGGTTGAAGGTAAVMAGGRNPATLPSGSTVTVRLLAPVTVTVER